MMAMSPFPACSLSEPESTLLKVITNKRAQRALERSPESEDF